jgi:hypothetical protein
VDVDGDGVAEGWTDPIGPNVCWVGCGLAGVSDLDADGTDELVLLLEGAAIASFGVADVNAHARPELVGYVDGEAPQGVPGDGPVKLVSGGDEADAYAFSCTVGADGPVIRQEAVTGVVEQPELGATVTIAELVLTNDGFVVVRDDLVTGVTQPPTLSWPSSLCDLELPW